MNHGNNWNPKQGIKEFFGMLRKDTEVILISFGNLGDKMRPSHYPGTEMASSTMLVKKNIFLKIFFHFNNVMLIKLGCHVMRVKIVL